MVLEVWEGFFELQVEALAWCVLVGVHVPLYVVLSGEVLEELFVGGFE